VGPPQRASPWRMVVSAAVTLAVLAVVFLGVFPKVADYPEAWSSIQQLPVGYLVGLLASGVVEGSYLLLAGLGILAVGAAVVVFAVVLRSEAGAGAVGRWGDRLVGPLMRRFAGGRSLDLTGKVLDFRSSVVGVMQTRWLLVTLSTLLSQLTSWAILAIALRGLEVGAGEATVTWTEALAAFSFARVASFIPITRAASAPSMPPWRPCSPASAPPAARPSPPTWCGGRPPTSPRSSSAP
jgi:hypothetical protein